MNKKLGVLFLLFVCAWGSQAQSLSFYQGEYKSGKFESISKALDSLKKCCPAYAQADPDGWSYLLANTKMKLGKFQEAKSVYETIGFQPDDYSLNYGICLLKNNLFDEAFKHLNGYYSGHEEEYRAI
jgi:hypothetical protein